MIKFSINTKALKSTESDVKKAFEKVIRNQTMLREMGNVVVQDVKFQTKRGNSIPLNGKLKPLSESWKQQRAKVAQDNPTSEVYSKNRSNLSLTGQLLESINFTIQSAGRILFGFKGQHQGYAYKKKDGTTSRGKNIANETLAKYVSEDRPFLGIRDKIKDRLKNILLGYIRRSSRALKVLEK